MINESKPLSVVLEDTAAAASPCKALKLDHLFVTGLRQKLASWLTLSEQVRMHQSLPIREPKELACFKKFLNSQRLRREMKQAYQAIRHLGKRRGPAPDPLILLDQLDDFKLPPKPSL